MIRSKHGMSIDLLVDMLRLRDIPGILGVFKPHSFTRSYLLASGVLATAAGLFVALRGHSANRSSVRKAIMNWLSEESSKEETVSSKTAWYSVAGLHNLANNCFLNVVLQALASCRCFYPYLRDMFNKDDLDFEENAERMPLTSALVSLLKDLCILRDEKLVLSPQKVMTAMNLYVSSFNLTRQQDAAEAFLHVLTSLEEEFSDCYLSDFSLADIIGIPVDIANTRDEGRSNFRRWQQQISGPFDGTVGSILACVSCASQLSMGLDVFRCLPLSPVLNSNGTTIMNGCNIADCLKQFTAAERIQNYTCSQCWHANALRSLSLKVEENEAKIETIGQCSKLDSCNCKNLFLHETHQPSGSSLAFKQLSIARCPKILCLHLQRASMSIFGEPIKLKGHVSFPLVMDLFPFTIAAKKSGFRIMDESSQHHTESSSPYQCQVDTQLKMQASSFLNRPMAHHNNFSVCSLSRNSQCNKKIEETLNPSHSKKYMYHLVSVVEHYGQPGSGHYAIYRRMRTNPNANDCTSQLNSQDDNWIYVSDSEVLNVPLETVLAAEASLLIYEGTETGV